MTETKIRTEIPPMVLRTRPALEMDEDQFFEFCRINQDWRIERTAEGDLEILPLTGGETSSRNFNLVLQLGAWAERDGGGIGFDSNGGCILPNGAMRSPDASRVRRGRLTNLTVEQKQKVSGNPVLQGFTLELRPIWEPGF